MRVIGMRPDEERRFVDLYSADWGQLVGLLIVTGATPADAEEVAQEAFIRLATRWKRIATYEDPRAWLRLVATRILISRHRRRRWSPTSDEDSSSTVQMQPPHDSLSVDLGRALNHLSHEHRAVICLHYLCDMSVAEISEGLKVPPGTVKSRLNRARQHLAPHLGGYDEATHVDQPRPR